MQIAPRRARVGARLSLDKIDFKPKKVISRRHNNIHICVLNRAPKYMKTKWTDFLKGGMDSPTVITGNSNSWKHQHLSFDNGQNNKEIDDLNNTKVRHWIQQ